MPGCPGLGPPWCFCPHGVCQPPFAANNRETASPICVPKPKPARLGADSLVSTMGLSTQAAKATKLRVAMPSPHRPAADLPVPERILIHDVDGDAVKGGLEVHLVLLPPERGQRLPHRGSPVGQTAPVTVGMGLPRRGTPHLPSPVSFPAFGDTWLGAAPTVLNPQLGQGMGPCPCPVLWLWAGKTRRVAYRVGGGHELLDITACVWRSGSAQSRE